ncbi:MAG: GAP family protein, partial [Actinobacteria bacterium]|nr:GAP family protein [Actinomycetota bacterium]
MTVDAVLLGATMALSPLAVLASVLLLTTERGTAKATAYAVGWVVAVGAIGAATVLAASQVHATPGTTTSTVSAWLYVVLGVALAGWAIRRRVAEREGVPEPTWMGRLDGMSPVVALGFGLFMPPYAIAVAAVNSIVHGNG